MHTRCHVVQAPSLAPPVSAPAAPMATTAASAPGPMPVVRRVLGDVSNQASVTSYLGSGALYKHKAVQQPLTRYFTLKAPQAD
jgi:hypothetical protein